ncbi:MAG: D-tyrosyl-tRNA(Tyr) deacylase [Peptococcaceae bacterium]|nr:D-tyrosyl-tRNA(Tyr) deacylase [Candidatus Syntrophopropionicum ammoniitolerans]
MRSVVQRVRRGAVRVAGRTVGEIDCGLVVLLGVGRDDTIDDATYLAEKIAHLRLFADEAGKMNLSISEKSGQVLAVSQFTLYGDCRKGRRPSFSTAASPEKARALYNIFIKELKKQGLEVSTGCFQEHMEVEIINDGPVTLLLDSEKYF